MGSASLFYEKQHASPCVQPSDAVDNLCANSAIANRLTRDGEI